VTGNSIQRKHNLSSQSPSHQEEKNRVTECAAIFLRILRNSTKKNCDVI